MWLPSQTGAFLDHAEAHRLYAMLHLIAFRGLRRGEAVGLRWTERGWAEALAEWSFTTYATEPLRSVVFVPDE